MRSAFVVPHEEGRGQVKMDLEYHKNMLELTQRINPKEAVVGWFSTGDGIVAEDVLIQEFYMKVGHFFSSFFLFTLC